MRLVIPILALIFAVTTLSGQDAEEEVIRLKQESGTEGSALQEPDLQEPELQEAVLQEPGLRGSWDLTLGTTFSHMRGVGSGMMFYTAPSVTMPLTNRWSLHGGMMVTHYQGFNPVVTGETLNPASFSGLAVFAAASYRMSERLLLHGSGVKQLLPMGPLLLAGTPLAAYPMDNISLGATYKMGDHVTIGASVNMNQGYGYYSVPMNGYMRRSPFTW